MLPPFVGKFQFIAQSCELRIENGEWRIENCGIPFGND